MTEREKPLDFWIDAAFWIILVGTLFATSIAICVFAYLHHGVVKGFISLGFVAATFLLCVKVGLDLCREMKS